jgi:hypothetical protein
MARFCHVQFKGSREFSEGIGRLTILPSDVMRKTEPDMLKESCLLRSVMERLEKVEIVDDAAGVVGLEYRPAMTGELGIETAGCDGIVISGFPVVLDFCIGWELSAM